MSVGAETAAARAPGAWRPRFHVTGERNWINDPNGPIQRDGVYHLFYQANPAAPVWGPPEWGHVSSTDLVTWTRRPPALVPEAGGPDADGCWSGCTRIVDGRPAIYYTGVVGEDDARTESVCRAWGSADLLRWERDPANPLVAGPPPLLGSGYHRDPFLWEDADGWHMLLGSGTGAGERHGQVLRYDSRDATAWTYGGVFFSAPRSIGSLDLGEHWECPQLLVAGDDAALIVSCQVPSAERPLMHCVAFTGALVNGRFDGALDGRLDHGDVLYAPALVRDESGRHLLWGWVQERLEPGRQAMLGHAGALSLPRTVSLDAGHLRTFPLAELDRLRRHPVDANAGLPAQAELGAAFSGDGCGGWRLLDGDGCARVSIDVDLGRRALRVTVADEAAEPRVLSAPLLARASQVVRVFIDGSLIEVFAGERSVTTRAYAAAGSWSRARLELDAGVRVERVQAWALAADTLGGG